MAGTAIGGAGEAVGDLGARLAEGFDGMGDMGGIGDAAGGLGEAGGSIAEMGAGAAEGMGEFAGAGAAWVGDAGGQAYGAVASVDTEGMEFVFFLCGAYAANPTWFCCPL